MKKRFKNRGFIYSAVLLVVDNALIFLFLDDAPSAAVVSALFTILCLAWVLYAGEAIALLAMKARGIEKADYALKAKLHPVFSRVLMAAKSHSRLSDHIRLYVMDTDEINAYALGTRKVVITRKAGELLDTESIEGLLCHELGHLADGHVCFNRMLALNGFFFFIVLTFLKWFFVAFTFLFFLPFGLMFRYKFVGVALTGVASAAAKKVGDFISAMFMKGFWAVSAALSRRNEYDADAFAAECGFGCQLHGFIRRYGTHISNEKKFFALLLPTHPDMTRRLYHLEQHLCGQNAQYSYTTRTRRIP